MEAAIAQPTAKDRLGHVLEPTIQVKLSLMGQISMELKRRYGTQQVAADAMELTQPEISALYNDRPERFSIVFLIHLAKKLGKRVIVQVA